ncbi:MAG: homoserine dehydrogenase [Bacteroidota bacterium]
MSTYKIGLFGFGCVGQGLYETLLKNERVDAEIVKICVKDASKERPIAEDIFVYNPNDILDDKNIDLVVELIDDAETAFGIVSKALSKGKKVVSANKKMVAERLSELIELQKKHNTPLLYEGAVCGSIPIIRVLDEYYALEEVNEIKGIFNGSTNYILTKVIEEKKSYQEALKAAQDNGFAESDPTLDVEGYDPKYKLAIVLQHIFGLSIHPKRIFNQGIQNITQADISFAAERGLKIKLLARAVRNGDEITAFVAPHFVTSDGSLFHIENEYNAALIDGNFASEQVLVGKGAGKLPTGLAVLSDVAAITTGYSYSYIDHSNELGFTYSEEEVYVSFEHEAIIDFNLFTTISEKYVGRKSGYIIGEINLEKLRKLTQQPGVNVIFTSGAKEEIEIHRLSYSYA